MLLTPLSVSALAVPPLAQASSTHIITTLTSTSSSSSSSSSITNTKSNQHSQRHGNTPYAIIPIGQLRSVQRRRAFRLRTTDNTAGADDAFRQWQQPPWPSIEHRRPTTSDGKDDVVQRLRRPLTALATAGVNRDGRSGASSSVVGSNASVYSVKNQSGSHISVSNKFSNKSSSVYASNNGIQYSETSLRNRSSIISTSTSSSSSISTISTNVTVVRPTIASVNGEFPQRFREWPPKIVHHIQEPEDDERITKNESGSSFVKHDYTTIAVVSVIASTLFGAVLFTVCGVVRRCRTTRRVSSGALARPIPLLLPEEDPTPLDAEPEHPVPMLSVQSPGYAGMERLGAPVRTSLPSNADDRRRMCVDGLQMVRDVSMLTERHHHHHHHTHHNHHHPSAATVVSAVASAAAASSSHHHHHHYRHGAGDGGRRCPHHVTQPDSEWGPDRDLHLRQQYQTEITRSYITPPPNKTALDVPVHLQSPFNAYHPTTTTYHLNTGHPRFAGASTSAAAAAASSHSQQQQQQPSTAKSKPNPIAKFFLRMSNAKSPPAATSSPPPSSAAAATAADTLAQRVQSPAPSPPLPGIITSAAGYKQQQQQQHFQHTSLCASSASLQKPAPSPSGSSTPSPVPSPTPSSPPSPRSQPPSPRSPSEPPTTSGDTAAPLTGSSEKQV